MKHTLMRLIPILLLALGLSASAGDKVLKGAIKGEHRTEKYTERDQYRNPYDTLKFFGIKKDMTVVEIFPGGGWYAEILANYLKDKGTYIAGTYDNNPETQKEWQARRNKAFEEKFVKNPGTYGKVTMVPVAGDKITLAADGSVDMILDFRNAHNWYRGKPDAIVDSFKRALKKGGIVGIVDHRLPEDHKDEFAGGYIKESVLINLMEKHGFELIKRSEINANPKDTADHPKGVWTLPPTLTLKDKDRDKYLAIGESDRMTLKFRKK